MQYVHYQIHLVCEQVQLYFAYLIVSIGKKIYKSKTYHVPTQLLAYVSTNVSNQILCKWICQQIQLL